MPTKQSYINTQNSDINTYESIKQVQVTPTGLQQQRSQETVYGTFQTKSAKNWDNELTQSAHVCNPCLALYAKVGYTPLYLALKLCKVATKTMTFDPSIERHTQATQNFADNRPKDGMLHHHCIRYYLIQY